MDEHDEPLTLEKLFKLIQLQAYIITQLTDLVAQTHNEVSHLSDDYIGYDELLELARKSRNLNNNVQSISDDIHWDNYHKEN